VRLAHRLFARPSLRLALVGSAWSGERPTRWINYAALRRRNGDCTISGTPGPWQIGRWGRYVNLLSASAGQVLTQFGVSGWEQGTFIGLIRQPTPGTTAWIATDSDAVFDESIRWYADNSADQYTVQFPNVVSLTVSSAGGTVVWNEWVMVQVSWGLNSSLFELLGTRMWRDGVLIADDPSAVAPRATTAKLKLASAPGVPSSANLDVAFFGVWREMLGGWASRALMAGRSRVAA
jgi:hypothetical protein